MDAIRRIPRSWDYGALALRAVLGLIFIMHGAQKVFGAFGGPGPAGVVASTERLGLEPAVLWAGLQMFAELGGGLMLIAGVLTEFVAVMIVVEMLVAIVTVHLPNGFFSPRGLEFPLLIVASCLALLLAGPGRFALWNPLRREATEELQARARAA